MSSPRASQPDFGPYLGAYLDGGTPHGGGTPYGEIRYRGPKHLISIGPPGSNKTAGLIVPNLDLPRSMIILDPKAQITAISLRKRLLMGTCVVLNPCNVLVENLPHLKSRGFNPLSQLKPGTDGFTDDAASIAASLVPLDSNEHQKHFPEFARDLYSIMIQWECMNTGKDANLIGVRRALTAPSQFDKKTKKPISGFRKALDDMARCSYDPVAMLAGRIVERSNDTSSGNTSFQDVIDTAVRATNKLDSPPIARDLCGEGFDFARLREEIITVYVILPTAELVTHSIWLRLVIASAMRAFFQAPLPPPEKTLPPVLFFLDEFAALGRLESVETALGSARDYGFQLWPFLQDLNQLRDLYPNRWENFLTGAGAVTAFAPKDKSTAEYLSELCGQRTAIIESRNEGKNGHGSDTSGQGFSPIGLPLILPEEIRRMPPGQLLCSVEPQAMPFFTQALPYPMTPYGEGLDDNPYFR